MPSDNITPPSIESSQEPLATAPSESGVLVCTIIARNYLPQARVLARSFAQQHPDGRFVALVIDDVEHEVESEPFEIWRPEDLDLAATEFRRMAGIYDLMALATCLKPWFLEALLGLGADTVIYLDPDIRLYAPLDDVASLARGRGIVLTPHLTAPIPTDGRRVTETDILGSGIYNLGFIALGSNVGPFLEFWKKRLRRDCYIDHGNQRFVDQRWIDLVPGMFDCHILRDSKYNVAYWNLGHRELSWTGNIYTIDGQPLGFFHFSGFDPRKPHILSKHQGDRPRILLSDRPALARICEEYRSALYEEGFGTFAPSEYPFDVLPNGITLNEKLRTLYREWVVECEDDDEETPDDLFSTHGAEAFAAYLMTPNRGSRLPLWLLWEWSHRVDLQNVFPKPEGPDYERLIFWAQEEVFYGRLHPRLVEWDRQQGWPTSSAVIRRWASPVDTVPGICVAGYLRAELGTGEASRLVLETVERAGIDSATFVYRNTKSRQDHPIEEVSRDNLNVNVIAINGDQFSAFAGLVGQKFFEGRYNIGFWAWELEEPPRGFEQGLQYVDEIWTVSEFSRASISCMTDKPVYTLPYPMSSPSIPEGIDRVALGLPSGFVFLFCFDFFSVSERKNPIGLIQAFVSAFSPGEGPTLVIKAINGKFRGPDLEQLRYEAADRPDIVIIDRYFDVKERTALMAACDCYVSLHRSEGFGLTMAEAMAIGKPVLATGYSGNLDFMHEDNSYLVPWKLVEVPSGCEPYPAGDHWAEPDITIAAQLMRQVVQDPASAAEVAARGQASVLKTHGFSVAIPFVQKRFRHAQEVLALRSTGEHPGEAPVTGIQPLIGLAASTPALDAPSPHPAVASVVRRVVRRAVVHQELHRQKVDIALAQALEALQTQVDSLGRRLDRLVAAESQSDKGLLEVSAAELGDGVEPETHRG